MYLVETIYGSRLFGTALPTSDIDKKRVFICDMRDLVFGKTETRNYTDDYNLWGRGTTKVETEDYHISSFCRMLKQGQPITLSLLFTPNNMKTYTTCQWEELVKNRHRLISKNLKPFVGYARSQAVKYSLKGERLRTLDEFITNLVSLYNGYTVHDPARTLTSNAFHFLCHKYQDREGIRLWTETTPGGQQIRQIEICGKSFGETTPLKLWIEPLQKMQKRYGGRAQLAKEEDGRDLKAICHAVRLVGEMNELLRTGYITYPRPEASLLLDIRQGKLTNAEVAALIDRAVAEGDRLFGITTLPEKPDNEYIDDWMLRTQGDHARKH